jgi:mercuric ion binding protein
VIKAVSLLIAVVLFGLAGFSYAIPKTVTLDVPGMTCSLCPITVKKALEKVHGTSKVEVSYEKKEAVVIFDDARTGPDALMQATRNAGYPSTVKGEK